MRFILYAWYFQPLVNRCAYRIKLTENLTILVAFKYSGVGLTYGSVFNHILPDNTIKYTKSRALSADAMWIEMKSVTLFEVIIVVGVLIDSESYGREVTINACKKVCCRLKSLKKYKEEANKTGLYEAFTECCRESKSCLLPEQFYNRNCTEQLMNLCVLTNQSRANNHTSWAEHCCKNVNNCPENNNARLMKNSSKCFHITVEWKEVNFPSKHDPLLQKWNSENWIFFLKLASQSCLSLNNSTAPQSSVKYTYKYPVYKKNKEKILYGYQAPQAFLVIKKEKFVVLHVVGESFKNLWITIFLCVTWTLISGVIIWLLVSISVISLLALLARRC